MDKPFTLIALNNAATLLISEAKVELNAQGHKLTGKAADSLEKEVSLNGDEANIIITGIDYLLALNSGVPASRIPYTPNGKRGGTSLYIQGLIDFVRLRGMGDGSDKSNKSIAFAIAHKHKIQWSSEGFGMPTANSYQFSQTGARTGFVDVVLNRVMVKIGEMIEEGVMADYFTRLEIMMAA